MQKMFNPLHDALCIWFTKVKSRKDNFPFMSANGSVHIIHLRYSNIEMRHNPYGFGESLHHSYVFFFFLSPNPIWFLVRAPEQ